MKKVRIGSGAGYAGDRIEPAVELMEKGDLDYIIFECLAERTVAIGQQDKETDPEKGYNRLLEYRMEYILPAMVKNRVRVITNMGAANPKSAAEITAAIAAGMGISGIKIAYVTGDDITEKLSAYEDCRVLEKDCRLGDMKGSLISANVYMGAEGIIRALEEGADLIITGRVSDPALTIAPLVYEFGWCAEKNPEQMGQAVLAGHLLECAGHVTGGYYADPGYKEVPALERLGFPLIEIGEDGSFFVTKVEGSGGLVSVDTCKEQMIYEIHNPKAYMTPDAAADFSRVVFTQAGRDRVKAECATSHGRPDTLKVSIGYKDGFIGEGEISYGGTNCMARAELAADIVKKRIELTGIDLQECRIDYIGYNSLYGDSIAEYITEGMEIKKKSSIPVIPEVRLRISGRAKTRRQAERLVDEIETLYTNGPAGGGGVTKQVTEVVAVCSIFVPREDVVFRVDYLEV